VDELVKYRRKKFVQIASELMATANASAFRTWSTPGIRAQLFDTRTHKLETDFRYEGDHGSFHVLNAVSPAFTCALPFSEYLAAEVARLIG
jgi:L-2-hydroxyglutarate oxidase